jgi:hypothetical protein
VGPSYRQKRAFGRALRDVVFRLCMIAGAFVGFFSAVDRQVGRSRHTQTAACHLHAKAHAAVEAFSKCINPELTRTLTAWLVPIAVGAMIGALLGVLLASLIRFGRGPATR